MCLSPCVMWNIHATEVWDNKAQHEKDEKEEKKGFELHYYKTLWSMHPSYKLSIKQYTKCDKKKRQIMN